MYENLLSHCYPVDLSAFRQTDRLVHFTRARKMASFLCQVPCTFAMMISLKKRIIKRFKRRYSGGCFIWMTPDLRIMLRKKQKLMNTSMFLILLLWLIALGPVCRNPMICQKTSQLCSTMIYISLILTLYQKPSNYINHLELNTNPCNLFPLSLKHPCLSFKQQSFSHVLKTCRHLVWIYTTLMNNLPLKRLKWPSSLTSATTKTSSTTLKSAEIFQALARIFRILMIQKPFCTIFFRKSSNIRAPIYHEADRSTLRITSKSRLVEQRTIFQTKRSVEIKIMQKNTLTLLPFLYYLLCELWDTPIT